MALVTLGVQDLGAEILQNVLRPIAVVSSFLNQVTFEAGYDA